MERLPPFSYGFGWTLPADAGSLGSLTPDRSILDRNPRSAPAEIREGPPVVIIPAHRESEVLPLMLEELLPWADQLGLRIVVGINDSPDGTAEAARRCGVPAVETGRRGYGHGCEAAIEYAVAQWPETSAFLFMAADGANDPADLPKLLEAGHALREPFVLGTRTTRPENRLVMGRLHTGVNRALGRWCGWLSGHGFSDLGPFRLIAASLYQAMRMRELTYGYTAESQIKAPWLTRDLAEVPVRERARLAGKQKISGVNLGKTMQVGGRILLATIRTRRRGPRACSRAEVALRIPS